MARLWSQGHACRSHHRSSWRNAPVLGSLKLAAALHVLSQPPQATAGAVFMNLGFSVRQRHFELPFTFGKFFIGINRSFGRSFSRLCFCGRRICTDINASRNLVTHLLNRTPKNQCVAKQDYVLSNRDKVKVYNLTKIRVSSCKSNQEYPSCHANTCAYSDFRHTCSLIFKSTLSCTRSTRGNTGKPANFAFGCWNLMQVRRCSG